jgi:hypothetical protein
MNSDKKFTNLYEEIPAKYKSPEGTILPSKEDIFRDSIKEVIVGLTT